MLDVLRCEGLSLGDVPIPKDHQDFLRTAAMMLEAICGGNLCIQVSPKIWWVLLPDNLGGTYILHPAAKIYPHLGISLFLCTTLCKPKKKKKSF